MMIFKNQTFIFLMVLLLQTAFITKASANDEPSLSTNAVAVIFETNKGSFTLELDAEKAPLTVANFLKYVDQKFYENTLFHRVIPGFMIQGGGFIKDMQKKKTFPPVKNESGNNLKNIRGSVSMARTRHPDSATSQFFINVANNANLDYRTGQPGYTVFGKVTKGMDVIDKIEALPTKSVGPYQNVPQEDVIILSAKRKASALTDNNKQNKILEDQKQFIAGQDYIVLETPVATRDSSKIEVIQMFTYGCPHCFQLDSLTQQWRLQQANDIDLQILPAIWNPTMKLYAKAFHTAKTLNISEKMHPLLFNEILLVKNPLNKEEDMINFFISQGIDKNTLEATFKSKAIEQQVEQSEAMVKTYKLASVPEIIVNGKYKIDRMRAKGINEMLKVADFLINKERALLNK